MMLMLLKVFGFNAPKGGNAVLTTKYYRQWTMWNAPRFNAPKGGNAVLTLGLGPPKYSEARSFQCPEGR